MGWFVKPDVRRLPLADGEWIEVKRELNVWEDKRYRSAGLKRVSGSKTDDRDAAVDVDWAELAMARTETYIVDWSLRDENGKTVPYTAQALRNLTGAGFEAIDEAIQKHIEEMVQEKKLKPGEAKPAQA